MTRNEIILPHRIILPDILSGKIDHLIRLSDKNKWTKNSIFDLKESYTSSNSIEIIIISSDLVKVTEIPVNTLSRCGYKSQSDFKHQWESWFQTWDSDSFAWIIFFALKSQYEIKNIVYDEDIFT